MNLSPLIVMVKQGGAVLNAASSAAISHVRTRTFPLPPEQNRNSRNVQTQIEGRSEPTGTERLQRFTANHSDFPPKPPSYKVLDFPFIVHEKSVVESVVAMLTRKQEFPGKKSIFVINLIIS